MSISNYPIYILLAPLAWGIIVACAGRAYVKAAEIGAASEVIAFRVIALSAV